MSARDLLSYYVGAYHSVRAARVDLDVAWSTFGPRYGDTQEAYLARVSALTERLAELDALIESLQAEIQKEKSS